MSNSIDRHASTGLISTCERRLVGALPLLSGLLIFGGLLSTTIVADEPIAAAATSEVAPTETIGELLSLLPEQANALVIVRVDQILQSDRARRDHWGAEARNDFLSGALTLPPWVRVMVRGTNLHFGPGGDDSTVAVLQLSRPVNMKRVAQLEGGAIQTLGETPVVLSDRNCYFAQLGEKRLGVVSPANRQDVSHWLKEIAREKEGPLDTYLNKAASTEADIVFALDMHEMLEPQLVEALVNSSLHFKDRDDAKQPVINLLRSLRGVRLLIDVEDEIEAELVIDFASKVGESAGDVRAIAREFLADSGMLIGEYSQAKLSNDGNSVRLRMALSDASFENVMTLAVAPHPTSSSDGVATAIADSDPEFDSSTESSPKTPTKTKDGYTATLRYFNDVNRSVQRLMSLNRDADNIRTTARWHENYADKIDGYSTIGVDPDVVKYGESLSSKLHAVAHSLLGQEVEVNTLERSVTYNRHYDPGWYGVTYWGNPYGRPASWRVTSNLADVRRKQADAVIAGSEKRLEIWRLIREEQKETRDMLVGRYGREFR